MRTKYFNVVMLVIVLSALLACQATALAQQNRKDTPLQINGELSGPEVLIANDRLYAAFKLKRKNGDPLPEELVALSSHGASWYYRSDSFVRVYNLEEEASETRPLVRAKFLARSKADSDELLVGGSEMAVEARFQPRVVDRSNLLNTDGIISYKVKLELEVEGKPTGKFLGYADKAPEFAAKLQKDYELRQVILVEQDKAATFRFVQDFGTSGK